MPTISGQKGQSPYPSSMDKTIASLEGDSNKDGVKGKVKGNGGNPDGKLGKNDLEAIVKNGTAHGVSDQDKTMAQSLLDNFDSYAKDDGHGNKFITTA